MKRVRVYLSGKVQGVFFRVSTREKAHEFNILGGVRNLPDGRVEVIAQAENEALDKFLDWCRQGPPGALVESVQIEYEKISNEFKGFEIFH